MPFTKEEYALLINGPDGITQWNRMRQSEGRKGDQPVLRGGFIPSGADLSGADLSGSEIRGLILISLNLREVDLCGSDLTGTYFNGSDLSNALLRRANCSGCNFRDVVMKGADMTDAIVENALIGEETFSDLRGLPKRPSRIRLIKSDRADVPRQNWVEWSSDIFPSFLVDYSIVEVYITPRLSHIARAGVELQTAAVHAQRQAESVYCVGYRDEADGCVLRFQGPNYDAIYTALPDLLAPFRHAAAIDWKRTLKDMTRGRMGEAMTALVKSHTSPRTRWKLARDLALVIEEFATARIKWLGEDRTRGVRIEVFTDSEAMEQLASEPAPASDRPLIALGPNGKVYFIDGNAKTGDEYHLDGTFTSVAVGPEAKVEVGGDVTATVSPPAPPSSTVTPAE